MGEDPVQVPVNEDFLFDVHVVARELEPVYWLGPVYDVRRGTWFYQEGTTLRPCEENLASQLEEVSGPNPSSPRQTAYSLAGLSQSKAMDV